MHIWHTKLPDNKIRLTKTTVNIILNNNPCRLQT